jgi:hypothetical protein
MAYRNNSEAAVNELVEIAGLEGYSIGELPKWSTPPAWLRNIIGGVVKQTRVTVQTPVGPMTVDLGDPEQLRQLKEMLAKAKVEVGTKSPSIIDQMATQAAGLPGGMLTVLAGAALLLFLLLRRR